MLSALMDELLIGLYRQHPDLSRGRVGETVLPFAVLAVDDHWRKTSGTGDPADTFWLGTAAMDWTGKAWRHP
jgi:hypothetical protein